MRHCWADIGIRGFCLGTPIRTSRCLLKHLDDNQNSLPSAFRILIWSDLEPKTDVRSLKGTTTPFQLHVSVQQIATSLCCHDGLAFASSSSLYNGSLTHSKSSICLMRVASRVTCMTCCVDRNRMTLYRVYGHGIVCMQGWHGLISCPMVERLQ